MRLFGVRATVRRGVTVLVVAALAGLAAGPHLRGTAAAAPVTETRALWVLRSSLASPESIATLIRTARDHGFNTLLVQVRGRGDAYFNGGLEPRAAELNRLPASFDPLATVLGAAHGAGLRVHAWVNVNLISSAADLPIAATHIVHRHPEWLMVPRDLAQELSRVREESPGYVGKIARWTRTQPNGRRPVRLPDSPRGRRARGRGRSRSGGAVRRRRRSPRLRTLSLGSVRLQPRRRSRVSRRCPADAARRGPPRFRCARSRGSAAVPGHVSGGVEGVSDRAHDGARRPPPQHRQEHAGGNRGHGRDRPRSPGSSQSSPAGLGRVAAERARGRGLPDGVHARARPIRGTHCRRARGRREAAQYGPESVRTGSRRPRRSRISKPPGGWARRASSSSRTTASSIPSRRRRTTSP